MAKKDRLKDPLMVAVGKVAVASRGDRAHQKNALKDARAELTAARLERDIRYALNPKAPDEPIRKKERERLAKLLREGPE